MPGRHNFLMSLSRFLANSGSACACFLSKDTWPPVIFSKLDQFSKQNSSNILKQFLWKAWISIKDSLAAWPSLDSPCLSVWHKNEYITFRQIVWPSLIFWMDKLYVTLWLLTSVLDNDAFVAFVYVTRTRTTAATYWINWSECVWVGFGFVAALEIRDLALLFSCWRNRRSRCSDRGPSQQTKKLVSTRVK